MFPVLVNRPPGPMAIGSSLDPLRKGVLDALPPILWDVDRSAAWALMEGDVAITHGMRPDVFVGRERDRVRVVSMYDLPGPVPWTYKICVEDKEVTMSGNVVLDVIYRHYTIESAAEFLLESAEVYVANVGESEHTESP
jgi:hypothetical protein